MREDRGIYKEEFKEKYGLENVKELRLIPYFQYLVINNLPIDYAKINLVERDILHKWKNERKIDYSMTHACSCSKEFWNWMNEVLWDSYAVHLEDE